MAVKRADKTERTTSPLGACRACALAGLINLVSILYVVLHSRHSSTTLSPIRATPKHDSMADLDFCGRKTLQ